MRIVLFSDTHGEEPDLPPGDLLLFAGDFSNRGEFRETIAFFSFLTRQLDKFEHIVWIAGNHDLCLDRHKFALHRREHGLPLDLVARVQERLQDLDPRIHYLENQTLELEIRGQSIRIHGVPQTPWCGWGLSVARGQESRDLFAGLDVDILLTHGPPFLVLDSNRNLTNLDLENPRSVQRLQRDPCLGSVGCREFLLQLLQGTDPTLARSIADQTQGAEDWATPQDPTTTPTGPGLKAKLIVFGHVHESPGVVRFQDTTLVNATTPTVVYLDAHVSTEEQAQDLETMILSSLQRRGEIAGWVADKRTHHALQDP